MSDRSLESPALRFKGEGYPFGNKVPSRIRMLTTVRPDFPFACKTPRAIALSGREYPCWVNSYGAVTAITDDGEIGVKPDEFKVVGYHGIPDLTEYDLETLPLLYLTNIEISQKLHLAVGTIENRVMHLRKKFDALNRTEVVLKALACGAMVNPFEGK